MATKHAKQSGLPADGGDATKVNPSDWYADHTNNLAYLASVPSGTLSRSYTFTSTVESWTTSAGSLTSTGSKLRASHTSGALAVEDSGVSNIADGEVDCDFTAVANSGSIALLFRYTDSTHYYAWVFQTGFDFGLYWANGGAITGPLATWVSPFGRMPVGQTYHLMARFVGSELSLYVNGSLAGMTLHSTLTTGRIGLRPDNATIDLDNVKIFTSPVTTGNIIVP